MASERPAERSVHEGSSDAAFVTRRNIVALQAFDTSSDKWSKAIVALTVVLVTFTGVLIYLAWALLKRGG